jgi:pimeloyl-ACP methyl ester carboxylesterase
LAFDIAGFGRTPPLPEPARPTIPRLVDFLEQSLRELRVDLPVDIAGYSLGGGMALEAARRGIARSAVAISPIGLWKDGPPSHVRYVFGALRLMARRAPRLLAAPMKVGWFRELALAVPVSVGGRRMPASDARRLVQDLAQATAFEDTFENTRASFSGPGIAVPITIAFGTRDWILTGSARWRDGLPPHTEWISKEHWGHVPMWADPAGVARLLLDGTRLRPASERVSNAP